MLRRRNNTSSAANRVSKRRKPLKPIVRSRPPPQPIDRDAYGLRFLELDAVVRDQTYDELMQGITSIVVLPDSNGFATWPHPLAHASSALHQQFGVLLTTKSYTSATTIYAKVEDFDFGALLTYFGKALKNPNGINLQDFTDGGPRQLVVDLHFSEEFCRNPPTERIERFARFLSEEGAAIIPFYRFKHVFDLAQVSETMLKLNPGWSGGHTPWTRILNVYWAWAEHQPRPRVKKTAAEMFAGAVQRRLDGGVRGHYDAIYADMDAANAVGGNGGGVVMALDEYLDGEDDGDDED